METDKDNQGSNSKNGQTNPPPNFNGPDLSGFFNDPKIWEWLKPLLSGAGAMTGTYFLWIKPMQEKMDAMNEKINEQGKHIIRLENEIDQLENSFTKSPHQQETSTENLKGTKDDYFEIKNKGQQSGTFRKRRNLHL